MLMTEVKRMQRKRTDRERAFIRAVRAYYRKHGRHDLPWRHTTEPYKILVSETMLQQTQVPRVIPKYREFLRAFPTVRALARAPLGDVLRAWQGLGYNRRAKLLWLGAQEVVDIHHGTYPRTYQDLVRLPGVGPYTAGAVMAFAYNEPVPLIETNIRTVYLHHFFADRADVPDAALLPYIAATLDRRNPRVWYAALMDYGTHLKQTVGNVSRKSRHYTRQSSFKGSMRQLRGAILRALTAAPMTRHALHKALDGFSGRTIDEQLTALTTEGLITKRGRTFLLP